MVHGINATNASTKTQTHHQETALTPEQKERKALNHLVLNIIVQGVKEMQQQCQKMDEDNKKNEQDEGCNPV